MANVSVPRHNLDDRPAAMTELGAKSETIQTQSGFPLVVERRVGEQEVEVLVRARTSKACVLHWGVRRATQSEWQIPAQALWPSGTSNCGLKALQTPFTGGNGERDVVIRLSPYAEYAYIDFVLFFPSEGRWDNNQGRNYEIAIPRVTVSEQSLVEALRQQTGAEKVLFERTFEVTGEGQLALAVTQAAQKYRVLLLSNIPGRLLLHWGLARRSPHEWLLPPASLRPPGTTLWQGHTAQTPFEFHQGLHRQQFEFPEAEAPLGLQFVLKQSDSGRWLNDRGGNFYAPVQVALKLVPALDTSQLSDLAQVVVRAETGAGSWTLMHRFTLCHNLLDQGRDNLDKLALLYVWLRFSALRQLTWQRNYNTKPRELSHAQERLTHKLADLYAARPATRPLVRLMLATVGRGGDGQRIRDEILHIMHRHHLKEVSGHFLEEWHQKLHNNTTPDDIVLCEAYLEFLRTNGNLDHFYQTLQRGGVTRQRLETFERPIRTSPDFVPHLREGLLHDFQNFLKVLRAVHSGTDLETAMSAARGQLDGDTNGLLAYLWDHRYDPQVALVFLVERLTEARRRLSNLLPRSPGLRELLYLDLALEQWLRVVVERNLPQHFDGDPLVDLIACVLENTTLSHEEPELAMCSRHWERLKGLPRFSPDWARHAKSVTDRIARALGEWIDRIYQSLQPKAEFLGHSCHVEPWAISLFSEEVVRGSSLGFLLSLLLRRLDPLLRQAAHVGQWQIISRGVATGQVQVVPTLRNLGNLPLGVPALLIADQVMGDEEIPAGVSAVIAPDVTDVVSHVAVRARNQRLLFAACHDPELLQRLKALHGRLVRLEVTTAGDVQFQEVAEVGPMAASAPPPVPPPLARPQFRRFVVRVGEFRPGLVGAKSYRQAQLSEQLPAWIRQPASVALPFGVFEELLSLDANAAAARHYTSLTQRVRAEGPGLLAELRHTVQSLAAPPALRAEWEEALRGAGIMPPADWEKAWESIKRVWASKWNELSFANRQRMGLADADLYMAVLVQPVVEADYAFVLHTVNPATGSPDQLYGEVVLGLGQTLVGNHPGRALSFLCDKSTGQIHSLTFPSKSYGYFGGGLMFRSDSNGEDLPGYAGAGLYDSIQWPSPRRTLLDYSQAALVWDEPFRRECLGSIARLGQTVESLLGGPQDIEGVIAKRELFLIQTRPQAGLGHG